MHRAALIYQLCRHMGPGWLIYRLRHAVEHRLGTLEKKLPVSGWDQFAVDPVINKAWRDHCGTFLFAPEDRRNYRDMLARFDGPDADWPAHIDLLADGWLSYFSAEPIQVGLPPKWNDNLPMGRPGPAMAHFSRLDEFGCGDVKCIWEPSRFAFTYDLVRAYWRTGDERAAELFWAVAEDWLTRNPPNTGINWKCGQESTFRMMAWCFALFGLADCDATTPGRVAQALKLMRVTGRRIEHHIGYALSQKNNHGISEAMGLYTIGLLFPFFEESRRWAELGRKHLESQARTLIYDDGGFVQHAANYHRVMLHDYLYAIRIGELNDQPLSEALKRRVGKAGRFLHSIMDVKTGRVPRYGQDDGALILPLTNQPYDDYRSVVKSTAVVCDDALDALPPGPWDEESIWLSAYESTHRDREIKPPRDFTSGQAGCHVLRSPHGMVFMRAQHFRHRPSQLDQLHVDVWWKGVNVALDPGTYSYNADGPWAGIPFSKTASHNVVMVQGKEQARQAGSRFLFLPWPRASAGPIVQSDNGTVGVIDLTGPDPRWTRRVIRLGGDTFVVLDDLVLDRSAEPSTLHWHLADAPHTFDPAAGRLSLDYEPGRYTVAVGALGGGLACDLEHAVEGSYVGWYSPRYMVAEPALWLTASTAPGPAKLFSVFGPGDLTAQTSDASTFRLAAAGHTATIHADLWPGRTDARTAADQLVDLWGD